MIVGIKILLLLSSIVGYCLFLNNKWECPIPFSFSVVVCSMVTVLYFAGLLNCLPSFTILIFLGGYFAIFICLWKMRKGEYRLGKKDGFIILVWFLVLGYFAVLLKGKYFIQYDNFTHWATIVKDMLINNRLPILSDNLITFQAYPPGSALFIYYVCKIIGNTEPCYSFGMVIFYISFFITFANFLRKSNILLAFPLIVYFIFVLSSAEFRYNDLLVDKVMPMAAVSSFLLISLIDKENYKRVLFLNIPICIFLSIVKNSGIFFISINLLFLIYNLKKLKITNRTCCGSILMAVICTLGISLLILYLWSCHTSLVFPGSVENSKHALSIRSYEVIFKDKQPNEIAMIISLFIKRINVFNQDNSQLNKAFFLFFLLNGISWIVNAIVSKGKKYLNFATSTMVMLFFASLIYLSMMLVMYLVSMSSSEALILAGYNRYILTLYIYITGVLIGSILSTMTSLGVVQVILPLYAISLLSLFLIRNYTLDLVLGYENPYMKEHYNFEQYISENKNDLDGPYTIIVNDKLTGYYYHLSRYMLWETDVDVVTPEEISNIQEERTMIDFRAFQ